MPNPVLIPFRAEHLTGLLNRDGGLREPWSLAIEKQHGPAMTGILSETILGCAGVVLPWPGVGLAWMVLGEQVGEHGIWMTRMVRRFLDDVIRCHNLHRIEAVVLADNYRNQRWIERLGFTRENGCARAYTQNQRDAIRYEWVRREGCN